MLTTLAPTLALHASPLPSSLQSALDPAYPVPLRSSACYEDALLAEERARNGSTQLRCSAPVEAPPDGVRYEKATFPVFIPKCECERCLCTAAEIFFQTPDASRAMRDASCAAST